jgi:hypothetical protein
MEMVCDVRELNRQNLSGNVRKEFGMRSLRFRFEDDEEMEYK